MMFIGYLYGIRSERQIEQEINLNIGYRWFLGLGKVHHHEPTRLPRVHISSKQCIDCPLLTICTTAKNQTRKIQRHLWESYKEHVAMNRESVSGKKLYRLRCQTIERSFADAKEIHGLLKGETCAPPSPYIPHVILSFSHFRWSRC